MSKTITIKIPPWISEEEVVRIVKEVIARLGGRVDVNELRRDLNIKPEDLVVDLEIYDADSLELKEKERLK